MLHVVNMQSKVNQFSDIDEQISKTLVIAKYKFRTLVTAWISAILQTEKSLENFLNFKF